MKIAQGQTALITGAASGIGMFIFALPYLQIYRVLLLKDAGNMQATSFKLCKFLREPVLYRQSYFSENKVRTYFLCENFFRLFDVRLMNRRHHGHDCTLQLPSSPA